jgi:hypothetical protein
MHVSFSLSLSLSLSLSVSFCLSPQYASLITVYLTLARHLTGRTTSPALRALNHSSQSLLSPGPPHPHDQLRVPLNSGLGSPNCHSSGLEGLATSKQNGSCMSRGFRRYLSRFADTRWPSGHHDAYAYHGLRCRANTYIHPPHTHTHRERERERETMTEKETHLPTTPSSFVRHKPCPPCIAAHPYVDPLLCSLWHHPAMLPPLLVGYEHHIVHLPRFYSMTQWCLSAPSRRPSSAGY